MSSPTTTSTTSSSSNNDALQQTKTATSTSNNNEHPSPSPPPLQTMCQKYGVQTYIIATKSDIYRQNSKNTTQASSSSSEDQPLPPLNWKFADLFNNLFVDDIANNFRAIGVDVEWGVTETPALIQISSKRVCFIIVVARDPSLLDPFRGVLADRNVVKAGVGIRADKQKIEMLPDFKVNGEVDLAAIVCRTPEANDVQNLSLARITSYYCGHSLNKDLSIVCSNWESEDLSREQLEYAADDALAGLLSFESIMKKHINAGTSKTQQQQQNVIIQEQQEPESTLLAPNTPSAYYSAASPLNPAGTGSSSSSSAFSSAVAIQQQQQTDEFGNNNNDNTIASPTTTTGARVNRTPIEWSKKYIKRKVLLRQPKNNSGKNNNNNNNNNNGENGNVDGILSEDSHEGVIARFQSQMERRYQTVSQTQDSLERVNASGVQAVGPDDTNLFCLDLAKASWYVKKKIAEALEYVTEKKTDPTTNEVVEVKVLKKIRLTFTPNKKTKVCRTWHINNGHCPNPSCPFAHGASDLKESIQDETKQLEDSVTAKQLQEKMLRTRCDMCRAQNAGISALAVVPSPWIRLMGEEVAQDTGCNIGLQLCCKCQALMRAVFVSERRHLRQQAAKFFVENALFFGSKSKASAFAGMDDNSGDDDDDDDNLSLTSDDDDDYHTHRKKVELRQKLEGKKVKNQPQPEHTLMAKITEASMTRMCSLCWLLAEKKRMKGIPRYRLREITFRINIFFDAMVRDGILIGKITPLSTSTGDVKDNGFVQDFLKETEERNRLIEEAKAEKFEKKKKQQKLIDEGKLEDEELEKAKAEQKKIDREKRKTIEETVTRTANTNTTSSNKKNKNNNKNQVDSDNSDDEKNEDPNFQEAFNRALEIANKQMNLFSKSDWLSSAEARDIARYFCLRPVDERERAADIVTKEEEEKFIVGMKKQLLEDRSLDRLRAAEEDFSVFWGKRMFEYYRTIFEQQLRPVVIPWKAFCRNPPTATTTTVNNAVDDDE